MPDLCNTFFQGKLKHLKTLSWSDLINVIAMQSGWQGNQLTEGLNDHLSQENKQVAKRAFSLRRLLISDAITIQARNF